MEIYERLWYLFFVRWLNPKITHNGQKPYAGRRIGLFLTGRLNPPPPPLSVPRWRCVLETCVCGRVCVSLGKCVGVPRQCGEEGRGASRTGMRNRRLEDEKEK